MPRRHRSSSSPLLSPPVLIILLPTVILLFLIYAIPPLLSLTSHILQPTVSVKKSWDSLNVFLVIFAILCGVFARKHDDAGEGLPDPDHHHVHIHNDSDPLLDRTTSSPQSESSVLHVPQQQWFGYSERTSRMYDTTPVKTPENVSGGGRLRRRSSYPDMRQVESLWETLNDVQTKSQFRFFDDFDISNYKTHRHNKETTSDDVKEIKVDTFVLQPSPTPPPKSPTPPPPPPPPPRREKQRTYETVGHRSKEKVEEVKFEEVRSTPPPTPPPPPPPPRTVAPPSPMRVRSDQKHGRLERRKSNVKKEIAMVWNSVLSNQRKRKRKQKATRNIYDSTAATTEPPPEQSQPPPPPPPPPPSSVFHNLFKKGSKTKKVHSVPTAPPPPPPPPSAVSVRTHQTRSRSTLPPPAPPTPPRPPPSAHSRRRPPLPTKPSTSYEVDNVNSGCQSPLIPIPPPPPPFKMPAMKFFVKGDFVKIRSAQSSRSASPEPEEVVADHALPAGKEESTSTSRTVNVTDGGDGAGRASPSVFCPSPDVNTKADNFIARLRDEWRLEKINSLREKKMN